MRERRTVRFSPRRDAVAGTSCFAFLLKSTQINTRFPRFHITRALPTRPEASIGPNRPHMALNVRLCRHARRTNTKSLSTRMIEKSRARRVISPLSPFPTRSVLNLSPPNCCRHITQRIAAAAFNILPATARTLRRRPGGLVRLCLMFSDVRQSQLLSLSPCTHGPPSSSRRSPPSQINPQNCIAHFRSSTR